MTLLVRSGCVVVSTCWLLTCTTWTAQLPWSLWLLVIGIVVLDFAVQVVHVSNQHVLTTTHPERTSSVIGGYMVFYSLGSALGAAATTSVFTSHGWAASSLLGAGFATCALIVWATDTRRRSRASEVGSEAADAHRGEKEKQRNEAQQAGRVADRSRVF